MTYPGRGMLQLSGVIVDLVYQVDSVPCAGDEAVVRDFAIQAGGGFNAMHAARRVGIDVTYGGIIGNGPMGDLVVNALASSEIDFVLPRSVDADQGCSSVLVDRRAERTLIAREGAEGRLRKTDLAWVNDAGFGCWLISGYQLSYAQSQHAMADWLHGVGQDKPIVFDPSPALQLIPRATLELVMARAWWISANANEASILSGDSDPRQAAITIGRSRTRTDGGVIVRDGANGCYAVTKAQGLRHYPGHKVEALDSNGAGDTHIGSFIAASMKFGDTAEALLYANIAAALSTTRAGPATAPKFEDVIALYR